MCARAGLVERRRGRLRRIYLHMRWQPGAECPRYRPQQLIAVAAVAKNCVTTGARGALAQAVLGCRRGYVAHAAQAPTSRASGA